MKWLHNPCRARRASLVRALENAAAAVIPLYGEWGGKFEGRKQENCSPYLESFHGAQDKVKAWWSRMPSLTERARCPLNTQLSPAFLETNFRFPCARRRPSAYRGRNLGFAALPARALTCMYTGMWLAAKRDGPPREAWVHNNGRAPAPPAVLRHNSSAADGRRPVSFVEAHPARFYDSVNLCMRCFSWHSVPVGLRRRLRK